MISAVLQQNRVLLENGDDCPGNLKYAASADKYAWKVGGEKYFFD